MCNIPPFSVLMSVYYRDSVSYLREALDSIFTQTLLANEVVLVKDGPLTAELDQALWEYEQKYSIIKIIALPKNVGLGQALNEGLKHCSHEYVARMDSDDICKPNRFEVQMSFLAEHPEVDLCTANIEEFIDCTTNIVGKRLLPETHEKLLAYGKSRCPVNHPVTIFKRSKVLSVGGYHGFPEDYCLWVKMLMNGCQFHCIQQPLLWMRFGENVLKRRGGWSYMIDDVRVHWSFYKVGFVSFPKFVKNIGVRIVVRLIPNRLRVWVYRNLLRTK